MYFALSPFVSQLKNPNPDASIPSVRDAMVVLEELFQAGKLTPVIDRTYPLEDVCEAMRYLQEERACGRIIITP